MTSPLWVTPKQCPSPAATYPALHTAVNREHWSSNAYKKHEADHHCKALTRPDHYVCMSRSIQACLQKIQTPQGLSVGTMATHEMALFVAVAEVALQLVLLLCQGCFGGATWNCIAWRPATICRPVAKMNRWADSMAAVDGHLSENDICPFFITNGPCSSISATFLHPHATCSAQLAQRVVSKGIYLPVLGHS